MNAPQTIDEAVSIRRGRELVHRDARTLSEFVQNCEALITFVSPTGKTFVPPADRDRARVYALARFVDAAETGAEVEAMLLVAPAAFEALLRAYHSLVASRGLLWWQSNEHASRKEWPRCIRAALIDLAAKLDVAPKDLAAELDAGEYPWIRNLVVSLAERHLQVCP